MEIELIDIDTSVLSGFARGLKPDPILSVTEWAEQNRILTDVSAEPGPFRMSRTPYMKEICDKLSATDPARKIVFQKSSQVGATETGNNWLGSIICISPAPMLYVMPTDSMMKSTSKKRIQPMLENTPALKEKIKPAKSRDSGNTILEKYFEGGSVTMVGANSPVGLASNAVRYVYMDEVDRYPMDVSGEGSAIKLAETRTATFGARKKIFITSTPTIAGKSAIAAEYEKTGQREYHVPCPLCGTLQTLKFENLRYEKDKYEEITYECDHCHEQFTERHKTKMLARGVWLPKYPEKEDGYVFGYFINALYSPLGWYSWSDMAREYEESEGKIPERITWINTKKGETYEVEGVIPQWEMLYAQREKYQRGTAKVGVAFITAGVDVQADRLEVEIVGWMEGKKSQSMDYRIISGDTATTETWDKLALLLDEAFPREDGTPMKISIMAVDTGYNTSYVYDFCLRYMGTGRVIPIKGKDDMAMMFSAPRPVQYTGRGEKVNTIKVYNIGVSLIKSELYGWLKQIKKDDEVPPGFCYFPEYDETYFRGITAERYEMSTNKKGYTKYEWVKKYKRNEPLDCRVYARAAASVFGMDLFNSEHWAYLVQNASAEDQPAKVKKKKKRSDFW